MQRSDVINKHDIISVTHDEVELDVVFNRLFQLY